MTTVRGFLISIVLALVLTGGSIIPDARSQTDQSTFSREQYRWAVDWINGPLETLMAHGVIESISSKDKNFQVHAGEAWQQLSFRQTCEILRNLSRARQITGHSPFFTVEQSSTGTVLGRVTRTAITVLVPGEDFIDYFPDIRDRENTAY